MPIEIRNFFCRCQPSLLGPSSFQFEPQHHLPFNTLFLDMRPVLCRDQGELFVRNRLETESSKVRLNNTSFRQFPRRHVHFSTGPTVAISIDVESLSIDVVSDAPAELFSLVVWPSALASTSTRSNTRASHLFELLLFNGFNGQRKHHTHRRALKICF